MTILGIEHFLISVEVDDPLGSVATHLGGGVLGVILLPFFMKKDLSGLDGIVYWKGCDEDKALNLDGWEDGACLYRSEKTKLGVLK